MIVKREPQASTAAVMSLDGICRRNGQGGGAVRTATAYMPWPSCTGMKGRLQVCTHPQVPRVVANGLYPRPRVKDLHTQTGRREVRVAGGGAEVTTALPGGTLHSWQTQHAQALGPPTCQIFHWYTSISRSGTSP